MAAPCVLFLDAFGLRAYRDGALDAEFAADDDGHAAFAAYLAARRHRVFHLLANLAEEAFQAEEIPWLHGRDRRAVVGRKLGQAFYGTPYCTDLPQGRLPAGRRDERVLLMALTRPEAVAPWLARLDAAEAPLARLVSLPQVLGEACQRAQGSRLLLTPTRGGLRQTFFADGRLCLSRLTPWEADVAAPTLCRREAQTVRAYLVGQRLLAADAPLPVQVLGPAPAPDGDGLRFESIDRLGGLLLPTTDADALFVGLLLRRPPRRQFAPPPARRWFRLRQIRRTLLGGGLAFCAGCLLLAALQLPVIQQLRDDAAQLQLRNVAAAQAYRAAQAALPPLALAPDRLRALVARRDELVRAAPGPAPLLQQLGAVLNDFPEIELERLQWRNVDRLDDAPAGRHALVAIDAVLPTGMAPREQLDLVERFAARLRAAPELQVRLLKPPFAAASDQTLRSSAEVATPSFSLHLAQRL
ncbi:MAG: hypothetical protein HZC24_11870 [Rhodocyclales bacterium]|nr:hypothetical protein [Rhodocyclales bacterium]